MGELSKALLTIMGAIVTVAIVALIVSRKSDTAGLVQSAGTALSSVVAAAVQPLPLKKNQAQVSLGGTNSIVDLPSLLHGDIDRNLAPLF